METASFSGLIRDIFYLLLIYYAIKFLTKLFLPVVAKKVVQKSTEQFQQQQNYHQNQYSTPTQPEKPKEKKVVGEYIEFEEVD